MADELPDLRRTVTVEEAHLLQKQVEHSEEKREDADEDDEEAYHDERIQYTEKRIREIETGGLNEQNVRDELEEIKNKLKDAEQESLEAARLAAQADTEKQILRRYFGDYPTVEISGSPATGYADGTVEFEGTDGRVILKFPDEMEARATADMILDCNGLEQVAAEAGLR